MANGLPDLNDLINYDKYKTSLPDDRLFRQSIADVDPVSAVTAKAVPSLQDTFAPSTVAASAPAAETGAGNQFLDLYNSLVKQNPSPVVAPDTSNQQLAEIAATSIAPALIGLILKGKQGAGIGAAIGGQAGAALSQRQRAEAIQQAQLDNQTQRETRQLAQNIMSAQNQERQLTSREKIAQDALLASENRLGRQIEAAAERSDNANATKKELAELKIENDLNKRISQAKVGDYGFKQDPETGKEIIPAEEAAKEQRKMARTVNDIKAQMVNSYPTLKDPNATPSDKKLALEAVITSLRGEGFGNSGASFTAPERKALESFVSGAFTLPDVLSANALLSLLQKNMDTFSPERAFGLLETVLNARERGFSEANNYVVPERKPLFSSPAIPDPTQSITNRIQYDPNRAMEAFKARQGVKK